MNKQTKILILGLLILTIISGCTTNNGPEIDSELEEAVKDLEGKETIKISVNIKDDSGLEVSVAKTDAEKSEIIEKITRYREEKASKILSDVQNNNDINVISSVYGIIRFEVTKKGFEILSKDSRISYMELVIEDYPQKLDKFYQCVEKMQVVKGIPGQILITFKEGLETQKISEILEDYNITNQEFHTLNNKILVLAYVEEGKEAKLICMLRENENVKYAEPNYEVGFT